MRSVSILENLAFDSGTVTVILREVSLFNVFLSFWSTPEKTLLIAEIVKVPLIFSAISLPTVSARLLKRIM